MQDENEDIVSQSGQSNSDSEEEVKGDYKEEDKVYYQLTIHLAFDIFSYLSQRASFDQDVNVTSQQDFISFILTNISKNDCWHNVKWIKFIMVLIVCNGGS